MMALFSSVYASRHHGGRLRRLAPDLPTMSELLQAHGYETAGFTANPVCGRSGGFDRGFDTFADLKTNCKQALIWDKLRRIRGVHRLSFLFLGRALSHRLLRRFGVQLNLPVLSAAAGQLTDEALAWLERPPAAPYFLWLHYIDLHWPYRLSRRSHRPQDMAQAWRDRRLYRRVVESRGRFDPGPETRARWQTLYGEELLTVDEEIGRLLAHLRASDRWARTALIVTGDHGEEFYEHGTLAHSWNQLFDEGVHVPLILRVPGMRGGRRVRQQVSLLDVAPTVLALAGIEPPETMMGVNLLPLVDDPALASDQPPIRPEILVEMLGHRNSARYRLAIRTETHRYIYDIDSPHDNQLYDRRTDPQERDNRYDRADPIARRFDELRFAHIADIVPSLLELDDQADALEGVDPAVDKRHLYLTADREASRWRFQTEALPLAAIYLLETPGPPGTPPHVAPVPAAEGLVALMQHTYMDYMQDRDGRAGDFEVLSRLAAQVPLRRIHRPWGLDALSQTCTAILSDLEQGPNLPTG